MKISFRLERLDTHAHFTLFVNGANAGKLCLRADEYRELLEFMQKGMAMSNVQFKAE